MIQCLYKDLRLSAHPTLYIFILLGALVIVPSYPYSLVFFFGCLAPFITMMYGRETNDIYYMALLPIEKRKIVTWGTLRKEGAPRLLYFKLNIVAFKRYSLSAMPFLLWCVPVILSVLGTLLPFLRGLVPVKSLRRCSKCPLAEHAFHQGISVHTR